jgi:uncharacterized protein (DUF2249 family)
MSADNSPSAGHTEARTESSADSGAVSGLTRAFVKACRQLGKAGRPTDAMHIATEGWSVLWQTHPDDAERINGVMHFLARLEADLGAQDPPPQSGAAMPSEERVIELRPETPKRRHEIIFDTYAALPVGETYVIINDHDPKPLWYQFDAEHKGEFTWEALEEGPEVWRVRIGRVAKA